MQFMPEFCATLLSPHWQAVAAGVVEVGELFVVDAEQAKLVDERAAGDAPCRRGDCDATFSAMSITAIVNNDTIHLPIHVPDGTSVEILLPAERGSSRGGRKEMSLIEALRSCPEDLSKLVTRSHDLPRDVRL